MPKSRDSRYINRCLCRKEDISARKTNGNMIYCVENRGKRPEELSAGADENGESGTDGEEEQDG